MVSLLLVVLPPQMSPQGFQPSDSLDTIPIVSIIVLCGLTNFIFGSYPNIVSDCQGSHHIRASRKSSQDRKTSSWVLE